MSTFDEIFAQVKASCTHEAPVVDEHTKPKAITLAAADLPAVAKTLHQHPQLYFDMLSCVTGVDHGPEAGTMEVVYNLYSIPFGHHLMLKVTLSRENPTVASVHDVWKTADWHEREIFDLYGIHFTNHPDLRRILLPADWEGHPLRKDYVHQDYYRNVKVKY